jgi:hypothetical protein
VVGNNISARVTGKTGWLKYIFLLTPDEIDDRGREMLPSYNRR